MSCLDMILDEIQDNSYAKEDSNYDDEQYNCSSCGALVNVPNRLIFYLEDVRQYSESRKVSLEKATFETVKRSIFNWGNRYAYSIEVEEGYWLTFCNRKCEIKFDRSMEEGWESSLAKK